MSEQKKEEAEAEKKALFAIYVLAIEIANLKI